MFFVVLIVIVNNVFPQEQISEEKKIEAQKRIQKTNEIVTQKGMKWNAGITSISYLSKEDFKKISDGDRNNDNSYQGPKKETNNYNEKKLNKVLTIPDWKNLMSPVETQAYSNCWAHAVTGVTEGKLHYYYGSNIGIDLDEMYVTDNNGCGSGRDGGTPSCGFYFIQSSKVNSEQGINSFPNYDNAFWSISSYNVEIPTSAYSIKNALMTSPVYASMTVYSDFQDYPGGIYQHTSGDSIGSHAVVIVGYNDTGSYWVCKNSWGSGWGESGYFRIKYGECGVDTRKCGTVTINSTNCYAKIIPNLISSLSTALGYGFVSNEGAYLNSGSSSLSGNVTITPTNTKFVMKNGASLNIGNYYLLMAGGTVTIENGASITNLKACLKDIGNTKGLFSTIQSACDATLSSGAIYTVEVQSGSFGENISVDGKRLAINGQGLNSTTINGSISISNAGYAVVQNLTCNGLSFYTCEDPYTRNLKINNGYSFYASNSPVVDLAMTVDNNNGTYASLLSGSSGSFTYQSHFSSDYRAIQLSNYTSAAINGTTFCGNTYDIYADGTSSATAGYSIANTYSGNPPSTRFYGYIDWNTNSYSICQQKSMPQNRIINMAVKDPAYDEFVKIRDPYFELTKKVRNDIMSTGDFTKAKFGSDYNDVINNFSSFINNNPNSPLSKTALLLSANCYKKQSDFEGMRTYLQNVVGNSKLDGMNGMAALLMMDYYNNQKDYTTSLNLADKLIQAEKLDTSLICNALFAKGFIYQNYTADKEKAIGSYLSILNSYPDNALASFAKHQLDGLGVVFDENKHKTTPAAEIEITFTSSNYPNPFNPTTTISYNTPEDGKVVVKVFDVLGRELATLVNGVTTAGKHSVLWDGNNFASGIYFYSVTFKNQTLYKKMLLVK